MNRTRTQRRGLRRTGEVALLVAICLLAFSRGAWRLGEKSLWWDESLSLHRAQLDASSILAGTITLSDNVSPQETVDDHPPLYFLLLAGAIRLFGSSEFALRYLSLACMALTVGLLYVTGSWLVDRAAGLAAAFLAAVSPMYLWYSQEARPYALVTCLGLFSFYCFLRAFVGRPGRPERRPGSGAWTAAYVLGSACMVLAHYLGILLVLFELMFLVTWLASTRQWRRSVVLPVLSLALVIAGVAGYALLRMPGGIESAQGRTGVQFVPLPLLLRDLLNSFSLGVSVDVGDWYVWLADLLFLALSIVGLVRLCIKGGRGGSRLPAGLLGGYLVVPVALIYLFSFIQPAYMASRHLMLVTPAFYLLLAAGLTWLRGRPALVSWAGWLLVIAGVVYSTVNYFGPEYDKDKHREWGAYLRSHVRAGDVVVVDPPHVADLFDYYASSQVPWIGLPLLGQSKDQTLERLQELVQEYDRVWLAYSETPYWGDPTRLPERWLSENAYRVDYRPFESISSQVLVAAYLPEAPLVQQVPDAARLSEVRYLPSLRLAGYRPVSAAQAGETLHVQLYWAVDEPIPTEASVSLRLVDGEGHLYGQSDQCPFGGLFPMWQWSPGKMVRAEHEVGIRAGTPPGSYQLELVLVEHPGEEGCAGPAGPILSPMVAEAQMNRGDRIVLGTVEVARAAAPPSPKSLAMERRISARFDGLELLGSAMEATELRPGERIDLRLYWRAARASLPDVQLRLVLKGASGEVLAERVIRPVGDALPTTLWQAEDCFEGQFWLQVPADAAAGKASVELAPMDPARRSGVRGALERWLRRGSQWVYLDSLVIGAGGTGVTTASDTPVPEPQGLEIAHPLRASLGGQVRLLGYEVVPASVEVGQPLTVTLYWQGLAKMDAGYTVFVHILGPGNEVLGQKDSQPRSGTHPTSQWQPGEVVTDTHSFAVSPGTLPGDYPIEVGMYLLETLTRLPVVGADGQRMPDDRVLLGEVSVRPAATAVPTTLSRVYFPLVEAHP